MPDEQTPKDTLSKLQELPQAVQDFILSPERSKINAEIVKKFKLTPEQEDLFFEITDKVIFKEIQLENFFAEVEKKIGLEPKKSKELSLEILGNIFLPLDSFLGNVQSVIKKLGGDPNEFAVEHIALQKISIEDLAEEILKEANISAKDSGLKRRLKNIIASRFSEARDDEETIAAMTRGTKSGGLGMDEETAEKMMQIIRAKIGEFQLSENVNVPMVKPKPKLIANTLPKPPDGLPIASIKKTTPLTSTERSKLLKSRPIFDIEDEREIEYQKKQIEKKKIINEAINLDKEVEKSIQNMIKKGKLSFREESLKQRFFNIVSARFRDVRDKNETMDILVRDRSAGGLGLKDTDARKVLNFIEIEFSALNKLRKKTEFQKLEEWKRIKEEEKKQKTEREEKKEEGDLEKRWTKLTGKTEPTKTPSVVPQPSLSPNQAIPTPPKSPSAPSKISSPPPQTPFKSPTSSKPKMEDIKFAPRLTGPIDELRQMTLVDFRRLAPTPRQAIEKIKDKIELLEDESYTKKIEGIRAWKESEPSRVYFEILNKSLTEMMPVVDILKERADKNLKTFSQEEFSALIELSKELRV